jgi:hypothetical protein
MYELKYNLLNKLRLAHNDKIFLVSLFGKRKLDYLEKRIRNKLDY